MLGKAALMTAGELAGVQRDREHLAAGDARLDAPADQARVQRVVAGVKAQVWVGRDPEHPAPVCVRRRGGQRRHHLVFLGEPVDRAAAQRLVMPCVRALREPGVELELEVERVGERPARLEAALDEVLQPLDDPLCLRVARRAEPPVDAQLAAERGELLARAAAVAVDAGLTVPDQRLRQRPTRPQTARDPRQQIRRLFSEDQRAGTGAGVAQARDHDPCPPGLTVPDRHLGLRLPKIELADLARAIDRPLKRPRRRREQWPHLAQIVIDDRLAALEPELGDQLADALARQPRISLEQPMDLVLKRIKLRTRRRPRIARRLIAPKRAADRLPVQPGPAMNLADRQAAHEVQPPHLRPLLHSDHLGPPELALRKRTQAPRTTGRSSGPLCNRRRWPSFHPAPTTKPRMWRSEVRDRRGALHRSGVPYRRQVVTHGGAPVPRTGGSISRACYGQSRSRSRLARRRVADPSRDRGRSPKSYAKTSTKRSPASL